MSLHLQLKIASNTQGVFFAGHIHINRVDDDLYETKHCRYVVLNISKRYLVVEKKKWH